MTERVTIIGGGSWGTALARLVASNNHQVLIYLRDQIVRDYINQEHINYKYFPEYDLPTNVRATTDLEEGIDFASIIILAIPTQQTREIMQKISIYLKRDQVICSTAKGFEEESFLRNSEVISENCRLATAVLSGPTHAEEVMEGLPTAVVVASKDLKLAQRIQDLMMTSYFRVYTNPDLVGVEVGGAVKNVIAVASGITDGLGYGDNTRATLITRGLHEMSRLGAYLGGQLLTFAGLTGMGDLVVTCNSMHSRNRRFGIKIGRGIPLKQALESVNQVVEGVKTTSAIYQWFQQRDYGFQLPITTEIYQVLFREKNPYQAVEDLMLRGPKHEFEEVVQEISKKSM